MILNKIINKIELFVVILSDLIKVKKQSNKSTRCIKNKIIKQILLSM